MQEILRGLRSYASLVHLLRAHAARTPDEPAVTFLRDGEEEEGILTYAHLDARARAIGAALQERRLTGERVLLAYPSGLEYVSAFFGCLYAGVTAVPIYPPRASGRDSGLERVRAVVSDTGARLTLTRSKLSESELRLFEMMSPTGTSGESGLLATDGIPDAFGDRWTFPSVGRETLAFLQYTSGSTSVPKGVMVSHGNIFANQEMIQGAMGLPSRVKLIGWLPLYHDMGLIGNLLTPICLGGHLVLMSPVAFLQRPVRWLRAISKYRGYISGGPNFGFAHCVRKVSEEQKAGLDLSTWRVAFNGSERVQAGTLDAFASAFASCGFQRRAFLPCYGLAETTLLVSGGPPQQGDHVKHLLRSDLETGGVTEVDASDAGAVSLVSCGTVQQETRIVDPETRKELRSGLVGEVWTSGATNSTGYWNRFELSQEVFAARISDGPAAKYMRTGDLGFLVGTGMSAQLYIVGRLKDLIIVDGRNLYPEDVERTVERKHSEVRPGCCAAFSVLFEGTENLIVLAEVDLRRALNARSSDSPDGLASDLIKRITSTVAEEHEARVQEVVLVSTGGVLKTTSGKLQRSACRAAFVAGTLPRLSRFGN